MEVHRIWALAIVPAKTMSDPQTAAFHSSACASGSLCTHRKPFPCGCTRTRLVFHGGADFRPCWGRMVATRRAKSRFGKAHFPTLPLSLWASTFRRRSTVVIGQIHAGSRQKNLTCEIPGFPWSIVHGCKNHAAAAGAQDLTDKILPLLM